MERTSVETTAIGVTPAHVADMVAFLVAVFAKCGTPTGAAESVAACFD